MADVRNKISRGFTLTEVIVVIAITSIVLAIMSIIMVSFSNVLKKTNDNIEISNEKALISQIFDKVINDINSEGEQLTIVYQTGQILINKNNEQIIVIEYEQDLNNPMKDIKILYQENIYQLKYTTSINFVKSNEKLLCLQINIDGAEYEKYYNLIQIIALN